MASRSIGSLFAELFLRDNMSRGLATARRSLNSFGSLSLRFAGAGMTALSVAMVYGAKKTMEMAGTLDDASVNTGIAVSKVMLLRKQFELGGLSADSMGASIAKMQRAISGAASGGVDPFEKMGLSAKELMNMDPADAFRAIGDAIMGISNSTDRAAAAMEIFGRSGAGMINVFGQARDAEQFLGRMPRIFQEYGDALARADDLVNELPGKGQQFVTGFTAGIIGQVLPALEKTANFDFTTVGENLGMALSDGVNIITSGDAWELFVLHADKALQTTQASVLNSGIAAALNTAIDPNIWQAFAMAGEIALLNMQTSPAINGLAAAINAIIDGFSPSDGGYSFTESFRRYADAGIEANSEIITELEQRLADLPNAAETFARYMEEGTAATIENIDEIQAKIDEINARARRRTAQQRTEASAAEAEAEAEKAKEEARMGGMSAGSLVSDYQRRGLSLDASGGSPLQQGIKKDVAAILNLLIKNFRITKGATF